MTFAVKVVVLLLVSLQHARGLPGYGFAHGKPRFEESPASYRDYPDYVDAAYSDAPVSLDREGTFGSEIPRDPPLYPSDQETVEEVNGREDIRGAAERGSRNFHPFDVALASRAIGRRIQEAIRQFSERFDLRFPEAHLPRYPAGSYHHFPPPPPSPLVPFHHPPPPPAPFPFHPPPMPFPEFPFQKPPHPPPHNPPPPPPHKPPPPPPHKSPPPPHIPPSNSPPPPTLFPFPPPLPGLRPPPPPPPPHHRPPPTMGPPSTPSNPSEQPTVTETPATSSTDVWDILLPWWYPVHSRPPTTKRPPQSVSGVTGIKEPTNTEGVGQVEVTTEGAETSTPPNSGGEEETTDSTGPPATEVEPSVSTLPEETTEPTAEENDVTTAEILTAAEEEERIGSTVRPVTEKVNVDLEAELTPVIGDAQSGPNTEGAKEATATEAAIASGEDEPIGEVSEGAAPDENSADRTEANTENAGGGEVLPSTTVDTIAEQETTAETSASTDRPMESPDSDSTYYDDNAILL